MLRNFLFEIAGCTSNFTVQNRQQVCINEIREKVGSSKVLVSELFKTLQLSPACVKGKQSFNRLCAWACLCVCPLAKLLMNRQTDLMKLSENTHWMLFYN